MATALITGASSGIGREFAWQLATAGHNLILVARSATKLNSIAWQLRAATNVQVEVLAADLTVAAEVEDVAARLQDQAHPVSLLVNNAGLAPGRFLANDFCAHDAALTLMVRTPMRLSHAAAQAMVARGVGAIVNVGSVAGVMTTGVYSAHKAWVQVFSESLAGELRGTGVQVMALRPGPVKTGFFPPGAAAYETFPKGSWIDIERLVSDALADLRTGRVLSTPTLRYSFAAGLLRLLPRTLVRVVSRMRGVL